jgi:hypothetical protein
MTEKTFNLILLSSSDSELLRDDYQDAIDAQSGTQIAKALAVSAYVAFIIPASLNTAYNAANQAKKEVMANICQETFASAEDFDTYYVNRYNELYP